MRGDRAIDIHDVGEDGGGVIWAFWHNRLMVLPGQKRLELRRGDDVLKSVDTPVPWRSGAWTRVRLRVTKAGDGKWALEGKAWPAEGAEPQAWQVSHELTEAPSPGRAAGSGRRSWSSATRCA